MTTNLWCMRMPPPPVAASLGTAPARSSSSAAGKTGATLPSGFCRSRPPDLPGPRSRRRRSSSLLGDLLDRVANRPRASGRGMPASRTGTTSVCSPMSSAIGFKQRVLPARAAKTRPGRRCRPGRGRSSVRRRGLAEAVAGVVRPIVLERALKRLDRALAPSGPRRCSTGRRTRAS